MGNRACAGACFGVSASSDLGKPLQGVNLGAFGQYAANGVIYSRTSPLEAEPCSSALGTRGERGLRAMAEAGQGAAEPKPAPLPLCILAPPPHLCTLNFTPTLAKTTGKAEI